MQVCGYDFYEMAIDIVCLASSDELFYDAEFKKFIITETSIRQRAKI